MDESVSNSLNIPCLYGKNISVSLTDVAYGESDPADLRLLADFKAGKKEHSPQLPARFLHHYLQDIRSYNGWQGQKRSNRHAIFLSTLAGAFKLPYFYEKFAGRLLAQYKTAQYLTRLSKGGAERYLRCDQASFLQRYDQLRHDLQSSAPGSLRIKIFRELSDLRSFALVRGISLVVHENMVLRRSMPHLKYDEYQMIEQIENLGKLSGFGVAARAEHFKLSFTDLARRYLLASGLHKESLAAALGYFDSSAPKFSVRTHELDQILSKFCRGSNCDLNMTGSISTLAELGKTGGAEVDPDGLPAEIKAVLVRTGHWELVKRSLSAIIFKKQSNDLGQPRIIGSVNPLLRRAEIAFTNEKGIFLPLWQIVDALVHEADHADPVSRNKPAVMQNVTVVERHSNARELAFLSAYEKAYGLPNDSGTFTNVRKQIEMTVKTANEIIGYDPNDLSVETEALPSPQFCRQRGVASADELDLSFYPAGPGPSFLANKADIGKILSGYRSFDPATASLLWEITAGDAELTVTLTDAVPRVVIDRPAGMAAMPAAQVKKLDRGFAEILASAGLTNIEPYVPLLYFGLQQKGAGPLITYRLSSVSLRQKLYQFAALR